MSSEDLMEHRCTIQRATGTNANGVITNSWAPLTTGVHCLLQEGRGQLKQNPAGQGLFYDAILFLPYSTDIQPQAKDDNNDRIVMTYPTRLNNATYLVTFACDESGQQDHLVAYLERVPAP